MEFTDSIALRKNKKIKTQICRHIELVTDQPDIHNNI